MADSVSSPMIDIGSSRVFDCNGITLKLLESRSGALFFRHARLNHVVVMKHSLLPGERRSLREPPVGTKLFFPFDERRPAEGGSTIFLHDPQLEAALRDRCGVSRAFDRKAFDEDVRRLRLLARLPTLDPFLLRDVLEAEGLSVDGRYLEIGESQWAEIQGLIQQRFVPIVNAAYPEAKASADKVNTLIEKLWEAADINALMPVITAFGLPPDGALDIFYAWKIITFYAYQFQRVKPALLAFAQWLKDSETMASFAGGSGRWLAEVHHKVRSELREQWSRIESLLGDYEDAYEKMFIRKSETAAFVTFLRNCRAALWEIGDALGKIDHAVACWDRTTGRYPGRRVHSAEVLEAVFVLLENILGAEVEREIAIE
jgi:hypothetical protein